MSKPSDFTYDWCVRDFGYWHNIEFRVDGFSLANIEVDDDFTVALIGRDELIDINGAEDLFNILMKRNNLTVDNLRWYAELMLPNLESVVFVKAPRLA